MKTIETIQKTVIEVLHPIGNYAKVFNVGDDIYIEPCTRNCKKLEGMQIIYFANDNIFEVSEYMAGKQQNELWIYKETPSLKIAIKELLKGNNRKSKIIKSY